MQVEKFIIYGAGERGKSLYAFLKKKGLQDLVYAFCDRHADTICFVDNKRVYTYEAIKELGYPFFISPVRDNGGNEIEEILQHDKKKYYFDMGEIADLNGINRTDWEHDWIAFCHIDGFNTYFDEAEKRVEIFWNEDSVFRKYFEQLDLSNVIELACGRGRHVPMYMNSAGKITLVDILEKNIEYCKDRFKERDNFSFLCNNGSDLNGLKSSTYTSLFTYDAMVHFEMIDIWNYLNDIYRILIPGGKALFHHSNNHGDYKTTFSNGLFGRNYMSAELFAYMAYRCGFEIIEQQVIDWGKEDLDCITLVEKK